MKDKKIFAIGDIHGCADELLQLIDILPLEKDDQIIFLGDYIDRGKDSKKVVDIILNLKNEYDVITLKGNHEDMFLNYLDFPYSFGDFINNGGLSTIKSYETKGIFNVPQNHLDFYNSLEFFYKVNLGNSNEYFFAHAGLPNISINDIDLNNLDHIDIMLWTRCNYRDNLFDGNTIIIHGHTIVDDVYETRNDNIINIDTGCVFGGKLTAIELPIQKLYQVDKIK